MNEQLNIIYVYNHIYIYTCKYIYNVNELLLGERLLEVGLVFELPQLIGP